MEFLTTTHTMVRRELLPIHNLEIREGLDGLTPARISTLYRRAPLLRRPIDNPSRLWEMFTKSSLVLTAWNNGNLAGIARVLTDGTMTSYLCDLAVEPDVQRLGVGKRLVDEVLKRCAGTELIVRDSDISSSFYAHLGFIQVDNAWIKRA